MEESFLLMVRKFFISLYFYITEKNPTEHSLIATVMSYTPPLYNSNTSLPVAKIMKEMKEANRVKMNIGVGSLVIEKVGDMKKNTMEGESRIIRNYLVGCIQASQ